MSEKRCNSCNEVLEEGENYCLFCGTKQIEIKPKNVKNQDIKKIRGQSVFQLVSAFVLLIIGSTYGSKILFAVGIFLIVSYTRSKFDNKDKYKASRISNVLIITVVVLVFIFGFNWFGSEIENDNSNGSYSFEIEPGYENISLINKDEMTKRLNAQIRKVTESYENLTLVEVNKQYSIDFDITNISKRDTAIRMFKQVVSYLYSSETSYPYIKDISVHYYYEGEYLYSARLYNLYLKEFVNIDDDGVFFDYSSNMGVLLKSLKEGYVFPEERVDYNQTLPDSTEKYVLSYEEWYGDFFDVSNEVFDEFDRISNLFMDKSIEPSLDELRNLEFLSQKFERKCELFNLIEVDVYYEVFHQYFSRGCQFYVRAYKHNLDGLRNLNIDRIKYSYIDYNIAYEYFEQIFEYEEDIESV